MKKLLLTLFVFLCTLAPMSFSAASFFSQNLTYAVDGGDPVGADGGDRSKKICAEIEKQEGGLAAEINASIVPCGRVVHQCDEDQTNNQCEFKHIFILVDNLARNFITVVFAPLIVGILVYIGFLFIKDQASAKVKAKALLLRVLTGTFFVLGAWLIVRFILVSLQVSDSQLLNIFN